jgi:tetratricopeptide (TPR) repeat protein/transglutaminase-like putative cysteine protease
MRKICALLCVLLAAICAAAQQPTSPKPDYAQEPFVVEQVSTVARFEKDGTGRRDVKMRIQVKTALGVEQWGQLVFGYNSSNEKQEIPYVRVRKADGSVVTAGPDAVQDLTPNVTRDAPMYTDYREKHVTVPSLRPGDTLEYNVVTTTHTALAPGQFWWDYDFEDRAIVLDERVEINVPKDKLFTLRTQPGFDPKIADEGDRRIYRWTSSHLKRKSEDELEKEARKRPKPPEPPDIRLTTFKSWEEVGAWYRGLERDHIVPNDAIRAKAEELTRGKSTDLEKVEALYNFVSKDFRYVSLSFGLGRYQPHPAAEIFANQYGDCKDKHTLLASLLDAVGIKAYPALMNSSRPVEPELPSPGQFDHVITMVPLGSADVWLDATPEVAPFRMLYFALRGKHTLVVPRQGAAGLRDTPAIVPVPNQYVMEIDGKVSELGKLTAHIKHTLRGDQEFIFRANLHDSPETRWKDVLRQLGGFNADITHIKVGDLADTSQPLVVEYDIAAPNFLPFSSKTSEIQLPIPFLPLVGVIGEDDDTSTQPLELPANPSEATFRLKLELPKKYSLSSLVPVAVQRDYGLYTATYTTEKNIITAERRLKVNARELPAARIRDYLAFTRAIEADQEQKLSAETSVTSAAMQIPDGAKIDEVMQTGASALGARDFESALKLFRHATDMEPKNWRAWFGVGVTLLTWQKYQESEEPFRKIIELDPYNAAAYGGLGDALRLQHKYADAEQSYRKQIELSPLDVGANGGLAQALIEQRKWSDAVPVLEKLVSLEPRNGPMYATLGQVYLEVGQHEKAIAALDRAAELEPTPLVWNNVAYELSKHDLQLDRAQQYAESAVSSVSADLRNVSIDKVSMREIEQVNSLSAYWDTLGWVHFHRGGLDKAEKFIAAAWQMAQHGEEGDHLAQIYEKHGNRELAIKTYAMAASTKTPFPEAREHLLALVKDQKKAESLMKQAATELEAMRTVKLANDGKVAGSADFLVVLAPGKVDAVKFLRGDEALRACSDRLSAARFNALFPDDTPTKLVRRGTLTCPKDSKECQFVLLLPDNVASVD